MPAVRKLLVAAAIIVIAAVSGFAIARVATTDGPDPHVDNPVVVRPAGDSDDQTDKHSTERDRGSSESNKGRTADGDKRGSDDKRRNNDRGTKGGGGRDSNSGQGRADRNDDDLTPVRPSPGKFDGDDDDDDDGDDRDDDDDDGGDDD